MPGADPGGCTGSKCTPSQKNCVENCRYSNRAVTLIKQSHDQEVIHNRLTMKFFLYDC